MRDRAGVEPCASQPLLDLFAASGDWDALLRMDLEPSVRQGCEQALRYDAAEHMAASTAIACAAFCRIRCRRSRSTSTDVTTFLARVPNPAKAC